MSKIIPIVAAISAALMLSSTVYAGENKTPDIDGKNNGSSLKYNQNCLDIAYKNAYGNASGKPTSSSDFKNYKCYVNGKVVPCTSMAEDDQTKKAEADYQNTPGGQWKKIDSERSFSGTITIGQYQNPDNASDTRYCRCMGRGDTDTPLGVLKAEGTTPKEMLSAFGEFTNGKTTQIYTWGTNVPSLEDAHSVKIEITDGNGNVTTATLSFLKYETAGRRLYYVDGYPFNLSKKVGQTLKIKVSW